MPAGLKPLLISSPIPSPPPVPLKPLLTAPPTPTPPCNPDGITYVFDFPPLRRAALAFSITFSTSPLPAPPPAKISLIFASKGSKMVICTTKFATERANCFRTLDTEEDASSHPAKISTVVARDVFSRSKIPSNKTASLLVSLKTEASPLPSTASRNSLSPSNLVVNTRAPSSLLILSMAF